MPVTASSTSSEICNAYFKAMDLNGSGYIQESEIKIIARIAFHENFADASVRWGKMIAEMDQKGDNQISKEEYVSWWNKSMSSPDLLEDDGKTFVKEYADKLIERLNWLKTAKTASQFCDEFFNALDVNGNGYIEEKEFKRMAMAGFGQSEDDALKLWNKVLKDADKIGDRKISKSEYQYYWMNDHKNKIQKEDGKFCLAYKLYLLECLVKLKAVKKEVKKVVVINNNNNNNNNEHHQINNNEDKKRKRTDNDDEDDDDKNNEEA